MKHKLIKFNSSFKSLINYLNKAQQKATIKLDKVTMAF